MSYMYSSTTEILRFHFIPLFIFPLQSLWNPVPSPPVSISIPFQFHPPLSPPIFFHHFSIQSIFLIVKIVFFLKTGNFSSKFFVKDFNEFLLNWKYNFLWRTGQGKEFSSSATVSVFPSSFLNFKIVIFSRKLIFWEGISAGTWKDRFRSW